MKVEQGAGGACGQGGPRAPCSGGTLSSVQRSAEAREGRERRRHAIRGQWGSSVSTLSLLWPLGPPAWPGRCLTPLSHFLPVAPAVPEDRVPVGWQVAQERPRAPSHAQPLVPAGSLAFQKHRVQGRMALCPGRSVLYPMD